MLKQEDLLEAGIPLIKSKNSNQKISKSDMVVPIENEGIIQWVNPADLEKAIGLQEKLLDVKERGTDLVNRKKMAIEHSQLKSYVVDPYDMYEYSEVGQVRTKRNLSFEALRMMGDTEIPAAIISTRQAQAARFAKPTDEGFDELGYRVRLKDRRVKASEENKKRMTQIEDFIYHTGWEEGRVGFQKRDTLKIFLNKIIRDRLTFDKINIELQRIRKGDIHAFYSVDPTTIFPLVPRGMKELYFQGKNPQQIQQNQIAEPYNTQNIDVDQIVFVQRVYQRDTAYFRNNEMLNICENPRSDLRFFGYGVSELEMLIRAVTAWINGMNFSTSTFTENRLPAGMISIVGNWNVEELNHFKDEFYLNLNNPAFKHKIPIMRTKDGKGVNFVEFKGKNATSEEQQKFLTFMAQICGALFRIDVEELGFQSVRLGAAPLAQGSPLDKIKTSKDKGFEPLMEFLSDIINNNILNEIDGGIYCLEWIGLKEDRQKEKLEIRKLRLETGSTVRQIAKENDEDLPEGENQEWLDAPADSTLFQAWQSEKMGKAQAEQSMEMEEGVEGEEGAALEEGEEEGGEGAPSPGGRFKPGSQAAGEEEMGKSLNFTVRRVSERLKKRISDKV